MFAETEARVISCLRNSYTSIYSCLATSRLEREKSLQTVIHIKSDPWEKAALMLIFQIHFMTDRRNIASKSALTHLPLVPHLCVSESGQHWFR